MNYDRIALIAFHAYRAYSASMCGPAPLLQRMLERMTDPKVGDLVLEISSGGFNDGKDAARCMGRLLKIELVPYPPDLEDPENSIQGARDIWTIDRIDGQGIATWENCRFIAIFETARDIWDNHS